jgi:hypothetical protein
VLCCAAYDPALALRAGTIRQFDEAITAVCFGWPSVDAYYEGSSSSDVVHSVTVPLLIVQASMLWVKCSARYAGCAAHCGAVQWDG